jgi:hypothetical protein
MKLFLNLAGVLTFMTGIGGLLSLRMDNIPLAILCLGWSALCFYFGAKHE